jgi:hypothetical protein
LKVAFQSRVDIRALPVRESWLVLEEHRTINPGPPAFQ